MNWIIVTGASRGLGSRIIDKILAESEFSVIGISRKSNRMVEKLESAFPQRYKHLLFDLYRAEEIKDFYLNQIKKTGAIYGLVNNAAIAYDDIVTNAKFDALEKMFRINVLSPILLTKYAIRDMLLHNLQGSVVFISSVSSHTGYKGLSMYASTKGALEAFSLNVAREWGVKGIRSNCIAPGFMETDMSAALEDEQKERIYKRTALKKATDLDSVASLTLFLLSDAARSITGEVIRVDSGTL